MNKFYELKRMLDNKQVVEHYLGTPSKENSSGLWYKSPFRTEKTASFLVSNKGIHDFGDSEHYDIISFVAKYYNTTQLNAFEILCRDFGINLGNEYENKEILKNIKKKRDEEEKAKRLVKEWYINEMKTLCDELITNDKCINIFKYRPNFKTLSILYDEQTKLECYFEELSKANDEDKIKLYLEAKDDKRRKRENFR